MTPDFLAGFFCGAVCAAAVLVPAAVRALSATVRAIHPSDIATAMRRGRR